MMNLIVITIDIIVIIFCILSVIMIYTKDLDVAFKIYKLIITSLIILILILFVILSLNVEII